MRTATYEEIREDLQTGDIVLFRGKGIISRWIRYWCSLLRGVKYTWSSHIGWVIRESDRVFIHESTSLDNGFKGVRLAILSDVIASYKGQIKVRHLITERNKTFQNKAKKFVAETLGKPYEKNVIQLTRSAWTMVRNKVEDLSSIFCSELVAAGYMVLGLLPSFPPSNDYAPYDFEECGKVEDVLETVNAELSEDVLLVKKK